MAKIVRSEHNSNEPLSFLKEFTQARIAIGSTGTSIPTQQSLEFKLAHAHAPRCRLFGDGYGNAGR